MAPGLASRIEKWPTLVEPDAFDRIIPLTHIGQLSFLELTDSRDILDYPCSFSGKQYELSLLSLLL